MLPLRFFFGILSVLATVVEASTAANPYQAVFLYYAYTIDFKLNGAGHTVLAKSCFTYGGRPCTLAQFISNICDVKFQTLFDNGLDRDTPAVRAALETLTPDVDTAAAALLQAPYFKGLLDQNSFLSEDGSAPVRLGDQYKIVTDRIQALRTQAGTTDISVPFAKCKDALSKTISSRVGDQAESLLAAVRDFNYPGLNIRTKLFHPSPGRSVSVLDSAATLAASPGVDAAVLADLMRFFRNAGNVDATTRPTSFYRHQQTINALVAHSDRLNDSPSC